ncbi:hypothetical protein POX_e06211 [Penicillium oxalicum]|uniref:hypothetical protein n=1 Tax=Penicillium oxalicum TaxID=69781 RepID=UPI0020B69CA9|nr:hypothetical protein POX_e06211 [Penicillium oxalicum]KAI2788198.1 hypothetical protein POX_e06211 [Penicillium oxalicum]
MTISRKEKKVRLLSKLAIRAGQANAIMENELTGTDDGSSVWQAASAFTWVIRPSPYSAYLGVDLSII